MRILILGGTTEAFALAQAIADDSRFDVILSLAGRTKTPSVQPVQTRIGGFGGADGLSAYLSAEKVEAIVDATHPFAAAISANAVTAAQANVLPLLTLVRPCWEPQAGDNWISVADGDAAARALGNVPRRVLLTIGRQGVAAFKAAPQHRYLVRSIDAPAAEDLPPNAELLLRRGPFDEADEAALLREAQIDVLVSKNSGGEATAAKLDAARKLKIPAVMIERPAKPGGSHAATVEAALRWLDELAKGHSQTASDRCV